MKTFRAASVFACVLLSPVVAWAAEPSGCDKFAWAIDKEQTALTNVPTRLPDADVLLPVPSTEAVLVPLVPAEQAHFLRPPERAPKSDSTYGSVIKLAAPPVAGVYRISLSGEAWIDVIQSDQFVKPVAFSGAAGCPGIRKSVKFRLESVPTALQLSGAKSSNLSIVISIDR